MANTFYQAPQVAQLAVALAEQDFSIAALISRNLEDDLLGGGGKGKTVNVKIPTALVARERGVDDKTSNIVFDELTETTVAITLGKHIYNAVTLSEGDLTLNLEDFGAQVLAPQVEAVVQWVEDEVIQTLQAETLNTAIPWSAANPVKTFTTLRKVLRERGVPSTNLNVIVGTDVYAALLDADLITSVDKSGSSAALRQANVGQVRGFTVLESTKVDNGEIIAFHRDAFTLAVRPPVVPLGAAFGSTFRSRGFGVRYLRDYLPEKTVERSLVSTFAGVAKMPLYKITRDYGSGDNAAGATATVTAVSAGAVVRMSIEDTEPA